MLSLIAAAALLSAGAPASATQQPPVHIMQAWVREAPPTAPVLAAYATFCNEGAEALTIVEARSEAFGSVQMHATVETGTSVRMERLEALVIAADECVSFEPGGRHFMLMDPARPLRAGDAVDLTLVFASGAEFDFRFPVRRANEMHDDTDHGHGNH